MGCTEGGAVLYRSEIGMILCLFAGLLSALCGIAAVMGLDA